MVVPAFVSRNLAQRAREVTRGHERLGGCGWPYQFWLLMIARQFVK